MTRSQHSITLRPAEPTFEEGQFFARYLDTAAEGFFGFMLGRHSAEILAKAFTKSGHDLSYQNVTFAERKGSIIGMVSGYTAEEHRRSSDKALERAAGKFNLRLMIVSILFAPLRRIIDTVTDGDFYIQAIAVDEEARGLGVGSILLNSAEKRALALGSTRLALDVSAENTGARKFYECRGWVIESQWPKRIKIPKLKFLRMVKTL